MHRSLSPLPSRRRAGSSLALAAAALALLVCTLASPAPSHAGDIPYYVERPVTAADLEGKTLR